MPFNNRNFINVRLQILICVSASVTSGICDETRYNITFPKTLLDYKKSLPSLGILDQFKEHFDTLALKNEFSKPIDLTSICNTFMHLPLFLHITNFMESAIIPTSCPVLIRKLKVGVLNILSNKEYGRERFALIADELKFPNNSFQKPYQCSFSSQYLKGVETSYDYEYICARILSKPFITNSRPWNI